MLSANLKALGTIGALISAVLLPEILGRPAEAAGAYMYGIDGTGKLIEYNPQLNVTTQIKDLTAILPGVAGNATAYDTAASRIWFLDNQSNLRFYDRGASTVPVVATASDFQSLLGLGSAPVGAFANAAYFDGDYWFIYPGTTANPTARLARLSLTNPSGANPSFDAAGSRTYNLSLDGAGTANGLNLRTYGDIAIHSNGRLTAATARQNFDGSTVPSSTRSIVFSVDLSSRDTAGVTSLAASTLNVLTGSQQPSSLQLAWDADYTNLYAVANALVSDNGSTVSTNSTGAWYTVDPTTGALTSVPSFSTARTTVNDLAGSAFNSDPFRDPDRVPGPLPLLGAAAAFGWSRRLRRRACSAVDSCGR